MKRIIACLFSTFLMIGVLHAQTSTPKDAALESLGSASGLLTYQIYLTIGSIADGYTYEAYDKETVSTLMVEQIASCKTVNDNFQKLLDSEFLTDPDDQRFIKDFIATMNLLSNEANALKTYVNDKTDANSAAYQSYRTQAWSSLAALLGFEE